MAIRKAQLKGTLNRDIKPVQFNDLFFELFCYQFYDRTYYKEQIKVQVHFLNFTLEAQCQYISVTTQISIYFTLFALRLNKSSETYVQSLAPLEQNVVYFYKQALADTVKIYAITVSWCRNVKVPLTSHYFLHLFWLTKHLLATKVMFLELQKGNVPTQVQLFSLQCPFKSTMPQLWTTGLSVQSAFSACALKCSACATAQPLISQESICSSAAMRPCSNYTFRPKKAHSKQRMFCAQANSHFVDVEVLRLSEHIFC